MVKQFCWNILIAIGVLIAIIPFLSAAAIGLVLVGLVWVKDRIESLFNRPFATSVE